MRDVTPETHQLPMIATVQPEPDFISYAQNREDVVLRRALHDVAGGRYIEVGANHPVIDSITRAFYDRGWSGLTIEPAPHYVELQRTQRPRDRAVQAAVTTRAGETTLHLVPDTGLSTIVDSVSARHADHGIEHTDVTVRTARLEEILDEVGWSPKDPVHFMVIDVEGAEADVLASIDLTVWRPWVLVVESTAPNSTEQTHLSWEAGVTGAGYEFCLFDGLSRFYVAREHAARLRTALSYPACPHDDFVDRPEAMLKQEREKLTEDVTHWRTLAVGGWAEAVEAASARLVGDQIEQLRAEMTAMQNTLSWKVTRPLRGVRTLINQVRGQ